MPISDLGFGASYHLDLGVPAELRIDTAELYGADGATLLDSDVDRDRATLETRGQPVTTTQAEVRLVVRPERRAFSREAWPTSLLVLLATIAGLIPIATNDPAPTGLVGVLLAPVAAAVALSFRGFADELTRVVLRTQQTFFLMQVAGLFITVLLLQGRDVLPDRGDVPRTLVDALRFTVVGVLLLAAALGAIIQWRAYWRAATRT